MNNDVSRWMRAGHEDDTEPPLPFIATRGYDSVVWNRLYSRDTSDLADYQMNQVRYLNYVFCVLSRKIWIYLCMQSDFDAVY